MQNPSARYSWRTMSANWRTRSADPIAAMPNPSGHFETTAPLDLNSAPLSEAPWRGSVEKFTGMPNGCSSANCCMALCQVTAVSTLA